MKLNLEIELDWIDEESNLDETVRQQVIDAVVSKIQKGVETRVEAQINATIDQTIITRIAEHTDKIFNDFMGREIQLTDRYGDVSKSYKNVYEIIKERFDNFMLEKVDEQGRTTTSPYGKTYDRLFYIIDKQLTEFANKFTTDAVAQVSAEIKQHVQDGLTTKLGAELMNVLKVNEMLQLPAPSKKN